MAWFYSLLRAEFFPYFFALLLSIPFLVLLRQFVYSYIKMKNKELKLLSVKGNSENKSQAYERLTLFLERIKPTSLVKKINSDIQKEEFVFLCSKMIQEEFEYNVSQQLYTTPEAWQEILDSKNYVLQLLQNSMEGLAPNATIEDYKTIFLLKYIEDKEPIVSSINYLRKEILLIT